MSRRSPLRAERTSHRSDWNLLRISGIGQVVVGASGGEVGEGTWRSGERVQLPHQVSLEGMGLLVSDPALVVLVEVVPGSLEV